MFVDEKRLGEALVETKVEVDETGLPVKLSDLVDLALDDLEKVEKDPRYMVRMSSWHVSPDIMMLRGEEPKCGVCFAGAVMAMTMKVPLDRTIEFFDEVPDDFEPTPLKWRKYQALDRFRRGQVDVAIAQLRGDDDCDNYSRERNWVSYNDSPERFKEWARAKARELREQGL